MDLSARFLTLCSSLNVPTSIALSICTFIIEAYTEPQRHYHTLSHVEAMLAGLDEVEKGEAREGMDGIVHLQSRWRYGSMMVCTIQ